MPRQVSYQEYQQYLEQKRRAEYEAKLRAYYAQKMKESQQQKGGGGGSGGSGAGLGGGGLGGLAIKKAANYAGKKGLQALYDAVMNKNSIASNYGGVTLDPSTGEYISAPIENLGDPSTYGMDLNLGGEYTPMDTSGLTAGGTSGIGASGYGATGNFGGGINYGQGANDFYNSMMTGDFSGSAGSAGTGATAGAGEAIAQGGTDWAGAGMAGLGVLGSGYGIYKGAEGLHDAINAKSTSGILMSGAGLGGSIGGMTVAAPALYGALTGATAATAGSTAGAALSATMAGSGIGLALAALTAVGVKNWGSKKGPEERARQYARDYLRRAEGVGLVHKFKDADGEYIQLADGTYFDIGHDYERGKLKDGRVLSPFDMTKEEEAKYGHKVDQVESMLAARLSGQEDFDKTGTRQLAQQLVLGGLTQGEKSIDKNIDHFFKQSGLTDRNTGTAGIEDLLARGKISAQDANRYAENLGGYFDIKEGKRKNETVRSDWQKRMAENQMADAELSGLDQSMIFNPEGKALDTGFEKYQGKQLTDDERYQFQKDASGKYIGKDFTKGGSATGFNEDFLLGDSQDPQRATLMKGLVEAVNQGHISPQAAYALKQKFGDNKLKTILGKDINQGIGNQKLQASLNMFDQYSSMSPNWFDQISGELDDETKTIGAIYQLGKQSLAGTENFNNGENNMAFGNYGGGSAFGGNYNKPQGGGGGGSAFGGNYGAPAQQSGGGAMGVNAGGMMNRPQQRPPQRPMNQQQQNQFSMRPTGGSGFQQKLPGGGQINTKDLENQFGQMHTGSAPMKLPGNMQAYAQQMLAGAGQGGQMGQLGTQFAGKPLTDYLGQGGQTGQLESAAQNAMSMRPTPAQRPNGLAMQGLMALGAQGGFGGFRPQQRPRPQNGMGFAMQNRPQQGMDWQSIAQQLGPNGEFYR